MVLFPMVPVNRRPGSPDGDGVDLFDAFSQPSAVVPAVIITASAFALLHAIASMLRNETYLHDVRVATAELKAKYIRELRRLHGLDDAPIDVDVIDEDGETEDATPAAVPASAASDPEAVDPVESKRAA